MHEDDDLDKTIIVPNPGGHKANTLSFGNQDDLDKTQIATSHSLQETLITSPLNDVLVDAPGINAENQVLQCARDLLNLAGNVRTITPNQSIEQLRFDVESLFNDFTDALSSSQGGHQTQEVILSARYILCCLIDELVLSTPWGAHSVWAQQTLLSKFHRETSGGEKFFVLANKLLEQSTRNIELIELCYVSLCMGFRGKYRVIENGELACQQFSDHLYRAIASLRQAPTMLSPNWTPVTRNNNHLRGVFSPFVTFTLCFALALCFYLVLLSNLSARSDDTLAAIESLGWNETKSPRTENADSEAVLRDVAAQLSLLLQTEIAQGLITLHTSNDAVLIRLVDPALFPPGSTDVNSSVLPNPDKLSSAILKFSNSLQIVGHTDATGRAESNWTISRKRAEAVQNWLQSATPRIPQMYTRGMADNQPIVDADDASENRRVELIFAPELSAVRELRP